MRKYRLIQTDIDFDDSSDSEMLSCETTMNSNDVRLQLDTAASTTTAHGNQTQNYRIYTIFHFQEAMLLFPGNECCLLVV